MREEWFDLMLEWLERAELTLETCERALDTWERAEVRDSWSLSMTLMMSSLVRRRDDWMEWMDELGDGVFSRTGEGRRGRGDGEGVLASIEFIREKEKDC